LEHCGSDTKEIVAESRVTSRTAHYSEASYFRSLGGARDATVYVVFDGKILKNNWCGARATAGICDRNKDGWSPMRVFCDAMPLKARHREGAEISALTSYMYGRLNVIE
jgi:hypothetical protein